MTINIDTRKFTVADIDPRIVEAFDKAHDFSLKDHLIMFCIVGSESHGTWIPKTEPDAIDDKDFMGVVILPAEYTMGTKTFEHWTFQFEELDVVLYSLQKFIALLEKGNPNVIGTLWLREEDYLHRNSVWDYLMGKKHTYSTNSVYHSFKGYAAGQIYKMTSFSPAIQETMDTLEAELEAAGWHLQDVMDKRSLPMPVGITPDEANEKAGRLRSMRAKYHAAYMGQKRKSLVKKHGYDTKNAAHCIRLLRMCIEFLETGEMHVFRTKDAEEIKDIKRGYRTLESIKEEAEALFEKARQAEHFSQLPETVSKNTSAFICAYMHWQFYKELYS